MTWGAHVKRTLVATVVLCSCGGDGESVSSSTYPATTDTGDDTTTTTGADTTSEGTSMTGDATSSSGEPEALVIDCGDPPLTAVGAAYSHTPSASGAISTVTWAMTNLPPGLAFDPITGEIFGNASEAGSFDVDVTATSLDQQGNATCTIEVADGLQVDLSGNARPCIGPGDDVTMYMTGGTGATPTCNVPGGYANGAIPDGVTVNPDTCMIEGSIAEGYGTWVWITEVVQDGYSAIVPYCMTQDVPPPGSYTITGDHSGMTDNVLEPAVFTFDPMTPIDFGGMGDPIFRIEGPCGANTCYYGYLFSVGASPFAGADIALGPSGLLHDAMDNPIGFSHELSATSMGVDDFLEQRPWVLSLSFRYCISDVGTDCADSTGIDANGNGELRFGLIALPN